MKVDDSQIEGLGVAGTPTGGVVSVQMPDTVSASTALGALNATVQLPMVSHHSAGLQLSAGTLIGTIVPEFSLDGGTTWNSTSFFIPSSLTVVPSIAFVSANTAQAVSIITSGGNSHVRVRVSAYTSGTANAIARGSQTPPDYIFNAARTLDGSGVGIGSIPDSMGLAGLGTSIVATNFVLATLNNTTAQLASGATFTGGIENVYNQQAISILLTADQIGTLTMNQYIDAAGTKQISSFKYTILPNQPFSRSFVANGNYFNLTFKNTGLSTTTTFETNVAYGTLPSSSNLGNSSVSLDESSGIPLSARPDGFFRVTPDPTTLIYDSFETLDTTTVWTTGGTVPPTASAGSLTCPAGTAANASSWLISKPIFNPVVNGFLQYFGLIKVDAAAITGNKRFWGMGAGTSPTLSVPVTDGAIFEIDNVAGGLLGSVYAGSTRTQTVSLVRPTDGLIHRYAIYYKSSKVYFEIDSILVGTISIPNLQVAGVSLITGSINGGSTVGSAPTMQVAVIGIGDSARNATQIADGAYPWRKVKVDAAGGLNVAFAEPTTYSATADAFAVAASPTDVFTITGSATKTLRIHKIKVTCTTTSGSAIKVNFRLIKRSTADSGGTFVADTAVPHDSVSAAATATVGHYTANPTLGTSLGNLRSDNNSVSTTGVNGGVLEWVFNEGAFQPVYLRGTSQQLCVNFNGTSITGSQVSISVEWAEVII